MGVFRGILGVQTIAHLEWLGTVLHVLPLVSCRVSWQSVLYWGNIGDNGKENGNYGAIGLYRGYIGIMEKQMETTVTGPPS